MAQHGDLGSVAQRVPIDRPGRLKASAGRYRRTSTCAPPCRAGRHGGSDAALARDGGLSMPGSRLDIAGMRGNRLVRWGERRIEHHSSGRLGSLVFGWLRRYAESSEYSAAALVLGTFLSMVPALLAVYALADLSAGSGNGIAQHLIYRLHIHQPASALVVSAFGSEASNAAAA